MLTFLHISRMRTLLAAMLLLLTLLFSVIIFMLFYLLLRKKRGRRMRKWKRSADQLIWEAIFFEDGDTKPFPVISNVQKWIGHPSFRQCLIDELVTAKKNLSGDAAANMVRLYAQLHLEKDSEQKLSSLKWHIKARGIQELAFMDCRDKVGRIYRHTNNRNEFIRMEAQLAIVQLYGLEGLRFLEVVSEPISEWQQIKLLAQLPRVAGTTLNRTGVWLRSTNDSVVLFSLKLSGIHHQFDLHDQVAACLDHPETSIRIQAVKCLRDICNETTAGLIICKYGLDGKQYKEAILEALGAIGAPSSLGFLKSELLNNDDSLKLSAARALVNLGVQGSEALSSFERVHQYPWNEIIQQAKSEKLA